MLGSCQSGLSGYERLSAGSAAIITSQASRGQPDISRNINEFTEVCLIADYVIRRPCAGFSRTGRMWELGRDPCP